MRTILKHLNLLFIVITCLAFVACDGDGIETSSNATVKVKSVQVVDKIGSRSRIKVTVAVSNLASGESVKMVGAKVGTSKSNPNFRDSRSGKSSATMSFNIQSNVKYYIIPFFKSNFTNEEVEGTVKTFKASN